MVRMLRMVRMPRTHAPWLLGLMVVVLGVACTTGATRGDDHRAGEPLCVLDGCRRLLRYDQKLWIGRPRESVAYLPS